MLKQVSVNPAFEMVSSYSIPDVLDAFFPFFFMAWVGFGQLNHQDAVSGWKLTLLSCTVRDRNASKPGVL